MNDLNSLIVTLYFIVAGGLFWLWAKSYNRIKILEVEVSELRRKNSDQYWKESGYTWTGIKKGNWEEPSNIASYFNLEGKEYGVDAWDYIWVRTPGKD